MKTIFSIIICVLITGAVKAQDSGEYNPKTLLNGDKSVRGFVGFGGKALTINNQVVTMVGAEVDLVFGHKLNFGFFGYGKTNVVSSNYVDSFGRRHYYELGFGGVKIEPVLFTNWLVHLTIPINMGAGAMTLNRYNVNDYTNYQNVYPDWESGLESIDPFVFVEPSVAAEINILKHMRLNAGVGYIMTDRINMPGTDNYPLNGFTAKVSLRLGWF